MQEFYVKSNVAFGRGAVEKLPEFLKECHAKKVMVLYGSSVKKTGIADTVLSRIRAAGMEAIPFEGVSPDPTNDLAEKTAKLAKEVQADAFVAVGGGSCIDLAKAVNVLMTNPGPIGQYGGIGQVKNPLLPLVAIPTTAGTSSEVTNVAALNDTKAVCKYVIIDQKLVPDKVIADPNFLKSVPPSVMAATGMDAVTHAVESYISNQATALTRYHSLESLRIFSENLPKAVSGEGGQEAREQMMLGCLIAGFAFSNANLGLTHAIAHTLSAHFHLAHGMANAAVLPYVMEYNAKACPEEMVRLAEAMGLQSTGDPKTDPLLLSKELLKLTKALGIRTLSEQGVTEDALEVLADDALKEPVLAFNPRQGVSKEDILAILQKAM